MAARAMLDAWLRGMDMYDHDDTDPFEMAVAQGLTAQDSAVVVLRDAFLPNDEPSPPFWLLNWAAKLEPREIAAIKAGRDRERAQLHELVEECFLDDPSDWTDDERERAAELGRRLSAVALVLWAREGIEKGQLENTRPLPTSATAVA